MVAAQKKRGMARQPALKLNSNHLLNPVIGGTRNAVVRDPGPLLSEACVNKNSTKSLARSSVARWLGLFGALWLGLMTAVAQAPVSQEAPLLKDGEYRLSGGEKHSYRISLAKGDFVHIVIVQKDLDVVVSAYAPAGDELIETDSPNDRWGSEGVQLIAEADGDHRIDVRSPNTRASAGIYEIKLITHRGATAADRDHAAAGRAFAEGRKLRAQQTPASQRAGIEKFELAASLFRQVGNHYRRALSLVRIGAGYVQLSEFRRALPYFEEVVAVGRQLEDPRLEAGAESFLGGIRDYLGDINQSLAHHERALKLARQSESRLTEANSLNNIGRLYHDSSEWQKALEHYRAALPIYRELGSAQRESIALNNIGVTYLLSGDSEKALEYLQSSLPLLRAGTDRNAEAQTLSNIANATYRLGRYDEALELLSQALTLLQKTGNKVVEAETLDLIGSVHTALGQNEKALQFHQQAVAIQKTTGNLRREATTLSNLGNVYNLLQRPHDAVTQLQEAARLFRAIGDLNSLAIALERIARAHRARDEIAEARKAIEESLHLIETVRTRSVNPSLRTSYFAAREQAYEFYVDLLMQLHQKEPARRYDAEALTAVERGKARGLLEMLAEATVDIRHGTDPTLLSRERDLAQSLNAKAQRQIQLLAQKGSAEEIEILKREIGQLEDEYQQVQTRIKQSSPAYATLTQPKPLGLGEIQAQLSSDTLLLEFSLGAQRSYLWVVSSTQLRSFVLPARDDIQQVTRRVYELLTTRSQTKAGESKTEAKARAAKADEELTAALPKLGSMVLGPAANLLEGKRLVIVPDEALQFVPFGALAISPGAPHLIEKHELVTLPSASTLAIQRRNLADRKPAPRTMVVVADPVFSDADKRITARPSRENETKSAELTRIIEHVGDAESKGRIRRLPFTRQEAERILSVAPHRSNLRVLDFDASRDLATSGKLSRYRFVHFATHGYIDNERPDLSAIVLSLVDREGNSQNGFLRVHDIYNLNLPAELVVLSACQTGLGKDIKGEGLVGLTRGFMYAGARRLVVSLWNVNDMATAELMHRFYRGMLKQGMSPAAALREAQTQMAKHPRWSSPYFWAAFVVQGEWN